MNDDKEVLTMKEAAQYLGVSIWFVRDHVNKKKIPHRRIGKRVIRFSKIALEFWLSGKD